MQVVEEFYLVVAKKMSVADFEQWVYTTPELETILSEDNYIRLISFNYNSRWAFYELQKLLVPYVDRGEMRKRELLELLHTLADGGSPDDVLDALMDTFNLFYKGYSFFDELAHYGLAAEDDFGFDPEEKWLRMTDRQKQKYLSKFYPQVQKLAQQLIQQLESGQIQLHTQGLDDEITYTETSVIATAEEPESLKTEASSAKQWWQFWK
jgi:hypothetical protein